MLDKNIRPLSSTELSGRTEEPFLFGIKDEEKIETFEKMLSSQLHTFDSISEAVQKMVGAALAAEFGQDFLKKKQAGNMIRVISDSILCESELRKQALLVIDKFTQAQELNA